MVESDQSAGGTDDAGVEHGIKIKQRELFTGEITVEGRHRLVEDGGPSLNAAGPISISYECECGDRFLKAKTAHEHLEEVADAE